jgi:hypothetical protein
MLEMKIWGDIPIPFQFCCPFGETDRGLLAQSDEFLLKQLA